MTNGANYKRGKLHHSPWHCDIHTPNQLNMFQLTHRWVLEGLGDRTLKFSVSVRGSPLIAVMIHVIQASTHDYHLEVDTIGH